MTDHAEHQAVALSLPARDTEGHKGTFGTVLVVGGACTPRWMPGAVGLAGRAALRSGCGLAAVAVPSPLLGPVATVLPEATLIPLETALSVRREDVDVVGVHMRDAHSVVCGPGLGEPEGVELLVESVVAFEDRPRVIDADALNALARLGVAGVRGPIVLTPHPGEWSRLARAYGVEADPLDDERRPLAAIRLARALDLGGSPVVVVLKGARTIVADATRWWRCDQPNPALATAGSGDVLAGLLGGLLAQFHPRAGARPNPRTRDVFDLACIGVHWHSIAGRLWSERHGDAGLLAQDLADEIPHARTVIQSGHD